ncbi:AMP-binding protein [Paraburkholderia domus]|uniref:AMP-binding protein n=1 Tax=Paraburkholderia domus TaxID=2793075 RepID=UPI0019149E65|nr:AMP-binding protein [Paraburkholderia domus]MCI0146249.1 AMP-binding protein [Paraburkholderia sediminicola]CAE6701256.1 3-[(3aS,4S,7aS)-7a-methyl-1, 5-dioxo-octahydro-1H-inden-4-yl]propanoyl:CoA ligase [Paraburkholderia domus]CAE6797816.1 3-[(3aS,4S,7aS)-7a-methyl-1, 5-dioxo-octahydro-1H-inden-4-yl]propanoyl:CoA ligase [Paraburkholderia domus]CAE6875689.1 3-[(3aS,4S,7aS)-7a-methyl-1, 5-dioxo-octahydro-1H-inden-4-yl]propanoyl:CoA ligase [Paraburkholderia domus]CAE6909954.1 3-[(3aS,4S,7aS)-7
MQAELKLEESYWPADRAPDLWETTLGDVLRDAARQVPDRIAFVEGNAATKATRRWSYRELLSAAERVAFALLKRFAPGDRVAVWSPNSAEWILLQHGASLAGLVLVTVNPAYLADEVRHVLRSARAAGIFFTAAYRNTDQRAIVDAIAPSLPHLREMICFDDWAQFCEAGDSPVELPRVQPTDMVQIQFTSGTTGFPKGACLHHRGLVNASRFASLRANFPEGGVWVSAMPLFHVGGCAGSQLGAFTRLGTFVMLTQFDAAFMLDLIAGERGNHIHAVPTMVIALMEHPSRPRLDLTSLKVIMSGGTPVPAPLVVKVMQTFDCRFTITFGQTELNGVICQTFPDDTPERQAETIGRPAPQMEVKIADPQTGATLPLGQTGEIWARGYQSMLGYFDMHEASKSTLREDGWLRTGDQARMDEHGYLRITGRLKDSIIRGGENIYPKEIEDVLWTHQAVAQVAVVGAPDSKWGEIVAAVVRFKDDIPMPTADDLHAFCRARLAAYKTPALWFFVDEFPATSSGKIQKYRLREQIAAGELVSEPRIVSQTAAPSVAKASIA